MSLEPTQDESLDILSNRLKLLQRRRGHRAASDDLLLAWAGLTHAKQPKLFLDLGTGKATVALLMMSIDQRMRGHGVEAFEQSFKLALRNLRLNGLDHRMTLTHGDIRDFPPPIDGRRYDLITGAPPFMRVGSGVLPKDAQRAAGRFELRGGVDDYFCAAAGMLSESGRAVILMDGLGDQRAVDAARRHGLYVHRVIYILPRPHTKPTYAITVAGLRQERMANLTISMRNVTGDGWTDAFQDIRRFLDLPNSS